MSALAVLLAGVLTASKVIDDLGTFVPASRVRRDLFSLMVVMIVVSVVALALSLITDPLPPMGCRPPICLFVPLS